LQACYGEEIVKNRRNLTPPTGVSNVSSVPAGVHATRRAGARLEVSDRVCLRSASGKVLEGWALNVSRGGVRVILEESVEPGASYEVTLTAGVDPPASSGGATSLATRHTGRVVWVQEEPDGVVAGIEFTPDDGKP
jgi:hypothetical protein